MIPKTQELLTCSNNPKSPVNLQVIIFPYKILKVTHERSRSWKAPVCKPRPEALIRIRTDENIRQMLDETTRNKDISGKTAPRPIQFAIDRAWKQCHAATYKNPKHEYRVLQKRNDRPQGKQRVHEETD